MTSAAVLLGSATYSFCGYGLSGILPAHDGAQHDTKAGPLLPSAGSSTGLYLLGTAHQPGQDFLPLALQPEAPQPKSSFPFSPFTGVRSATLSEDLPLPSPALSRLCLSQMVSPKSLLNR